MDTLPKEMILEIFKFLTSRDLLVLTQVCYEFNKLISSSERLLEKIPFYVINDEEKLTRAGITDFKSFISHSKFRRHTKIVIGHIDGDSAVEIIKKLSPNISQLTFKRGCKLRDICRILLLCPKVKRLKFCRGSLRGDDLGGCELPELKLEELVLENVGSQIFKVLRNSKVNRLECTIGRRICQHEFIPEELASFLIHHTDLKHLKLERIAWNLNDMFENNNLDQMNFHLQSLTLNDVIIDTSRTFHDFMRLHYETLKSLDLITIEDYNFSQILRELPKIVELRVINTPIDIYEPMMTVEKLEIEFPSLIRFFPQLKELKICGTQFGPYQIHLWHEYINNSHLESVEIGNLSLLNFPSLPSMKKLKLMNVERIYVEVFYENPQIEELVIEKRFGPILRYDNEIEFITERLPELRLLEVVGGKVCRRYLDLAKERCRKLKYLRLINVDVVPI